MKLSIPELSLVILIGPTGSGKTTFARQHFKHTEIVSSDVCRGIVGDDENDQTITSEAFELAHFIVRQRLKLGKLTVVDATNVQPASRKPLLEIARECHAIPVAIVFKTPERICSERNAKREDRSFGHHVIRKQMSEMKRGLRQLKREGFRYIHAIESEEATNNITISRQVLWNNKKDEHGPFDIIGDVHGCYNELEGLLLKLGYVLNTEMIHHPEGRQAVFVGDLADRGPRSLDTLRLVMKMVAQGQALCVPGNHDIKLFRWLIGKKVQITHGLETTIAELEAYEDSDPESAEEFKKELKEFIDGLVSHYVLDDGKLCVAHAGMNEFMMGRGSSAVREFAMFGETTGETDEFGLPIRFDWAAQYKGNTIVVYGHTPIPEPEWINKTINIDTGCVFGGKLTSLKYPELELESVPAMYTYGESRKPFIDDESKAAFQSSQHQLDEILDLSDVLGKRIISTRLRPNMTIKEENANAALEIISRFAVNPKWLIYLPPTMSPCETSQRKDYLEYPEEAFTYYRTRGIPNVICEEKHMGSRAIVVICKNEGVAQQRFGIENESIGVIYTRTGRPFIQDASLNLTLLSRIQNALTNAGFWQEFNSDWFCLDCELMPWSLKAKDLIERQYASTGNAALAYINAAENVVKEVSIDGVKGLNETIQRKQQDINNYVDAYQNYCWEAISVSDLKLAPFHLLTSEGVVHTNKSNEWHMNTLKRLCQSDSEILIETQTKLVDVTNEKSMTEGLEWWIDLTSNGGEGMVVKPSEFIAKGSRGLIQPAIKCRGREYLRIIYGPEYTQNNNLERLRKRGLRNKRSLALREFALGVEALERFVRREPLRRVHECVFSVLALESEPVDPRL